MGILTDVIGGNLGKMFKEVVGSFKLDPAKKAEMEAAIEENAQAIRLKEYELEAKAMEATQSVVDAQKAIIVAEMAQGDNFTKRARPSIVYAGLFFIFINHVLPALVTYCGGRTTPIVNLPDNFWSAWELVVSVWALGRTAEKFGVKNKATSLITGSK